MRGSASQSPTTDASSVGQAYLPDNRAVAEASGLGELLAGVALVSQAIELGYRNAGIKLLGVDCNSNYFREST